MKTCVVALYTVTVYTKQLVCTNRLFFRSWCCAQTIFASSVVQVLSTLPPCAQFYENEATIQSGPVSARCSYIKWNEFLLKKITIQTLMHTKRERMKVTLFNKLGHKAYLKVLDNGAGTVVIASAHQTTCIQFHEKPTK